MVELVRNIFMNIFILSWIVEQCAEYHCTKHVVKMILETTQLLSTCYHVVNSEMAQIFHQEGKIYAKTHMNHPSSIWTRECRENYIWLCHLGLALCKEYGYRYDKKPEDHKCYSMLIFLITHVPPNLPTNNGTMTMPKLAMPDQYKNPADPIGSYRKYYINDKQRMLVWHKRQPPPWVPVSLHHIHYTAIKNKLQVELNKLESRKRPTLEHLEQIKTIKTKIEEINKFIKI